MIVPDRKRTGERKQGRLQFVISDLRSFPIFCVCVSVCVYLLRSDLFGAAGHAKCFVRFEAAAYVESDEVLPTVSMSF